MTTSSDVPLSDAELARIEELSTVAHGYGGDEQELGEIALELVAERVSDERLAELLGPELSVIKYAEVYLLAAEVLAAREREAAIIGTGQIATLAIEDGRRALTSWCDLDDCECPVHEEPAPPAGTYVTVRMDGDPRVGFARVRITREPVTEGGDDD